MIIDIKLIFIIIFPATKLTGNKANNILRSLSLKILVGENKFFWFMIFKYNMNILLKLNEII